MDTLLITILVPVAGLLALGYAFLKTQWVSKQDPGTENMVEIAANIADGARAFLRREYRVLAIFVLAVAVLLGIANATDRMIEGEVINSPLIAVSFIAKRLPRLKVLDLMHKLSVRIEKWRKLT